MADVRKEVRSTQFNSLPIRALGPLYFQHRGGGRVELSDIFSHTSVCEVDFRVFCAQLRGVAQECAWTPPPPQGTFAQNAEVVLPNWQNTFWRTKICVQHFAWGKIGFPHLPRAKFGNTNFDRSKFVSTNISVGANFGW